MYRLLTSYSKVLLEALFALLSPPFCAACKKFLEERRPLCQACQETIEPIVSAQLQVKSYSVPVFALSDYTGIIKKLILAKHHSSRLAAYQLGQLMAQHAASLSLWRNDMYVVPVPLHWQRYAYRGYNQAQVMAQVIATAHGLQVSHGIVRSKKTVYQAQLTKDQRKKNVSEVFALRGEFKQLYNNKHILVVDDLMTTGVTLQAVIALLAQCQPASITVLVAARVV